MIARLLCWLLGHVVTELWVAGDFGGVYCPRCNRCSLQPMPDRGPE